MINKGDMQTEWPLQGSPRFREHAFPLQTLISNERTAGLDTILCSQPRKAKGKEETSWPGYKRKDKMSMTVRRKVSFRRWVEWDAQHLQGRNPKACMATAQSAGLPGSAAIPRGKQRPSCMQEICLQGSQINGLPWQTTRGFVQP